LIEKADAAVDAVSLELLRVDTIIGDVEELSARVEHTVDVVQDTVSAPVNAVNAAGERIRGHGSGPSAHGPRVPKCPERTTRLDRRNDVSRPDHSTVPSRAEYAKAVRMTASALVSRMGATYDDLDDVRIAAEELFVYACDHADDDS
jgi:hypothetical protein